MNINNPINSSAKVPQVHLLIARSGLGKQSTLIQTSDSNGQGMAW